VVKCPSRGSTVSVRVVTAPNSASGTNNDTGLMPYGRSGEFATP
jgi:hypothetical protein